MKTIRLALCIISLVALASCHKADKTTNDTIVKTGILERQGITTYQYGDYILIVDATTQYVLKSTTLNLEPFVGQHVQITATDTHYTVEGGPDEYDVTAIVQE